jgi:hypothetical protein
MSVSPKPKFLTRQLVWRLEETDTKPTPGDCAGANPPDLNASCLTARRKRQDIDAAALPGCASVAEAYAADLLTPGPGRMVQLRLLNRPQPERRERLAAGKLVVEPDAD